MRSAVLSAVFIIALTLFLPVNGTDYGKQLPVTRIAGLKRCSAVAVAGEWLYAAGDRALVTYRIGKNPLVPEETARTPLAGARQIAVSERFLFISARHFGVFVFDRSDPARPVPVTRIDPVELATGIAVAGDVLFVSLRVYGVELIDVSDPKNPRHLSLLRNCGEIQSLFNFGNGLLAMGDWGGKQLRIADVRNPRKPVEISRTNLDGYGDGVWVQGNYCYASTGHHSRARGKEERYGRGHGLEIFDVSDPEHPVRTGGIKFPVYYELGDDFWTVRTEGRTAYAGDTYNGAFVIDVSDPRNPKCTGRAQLPTVKRKSYERKIQVEEPDCVMDLAIGPGAIYLAGPRSGLFAFPADTRGSKGVSTEKVVIPPPLPCKEIPGLKRFAVDAPVRRLILNGNQLYACCSAGGLRLFRINGNSLEPLREWRDRTVYDAAVHRDLLFTAEGDFIRSSRIQKDGSLQELGRLRIPWPNAAQLIRLFRQGTVALCSGGTSHLYFLDVSDPAAMRLIERDSGRLLYGDMIPDGEINGLLPVNWHSGGIRWYDLKRENKFLVRSLPAIRTSHLSGVARNGNRFFLWDRNGSYLLLDPEKPGEAKRCMASGGPRQGIPSDGGNGIMVLSNRATGEVGVFDLSDPRKAAAIPKRCYDISQGITDRAVFYNGRMLIPAWNLGILMETEMK